MFLMRIAGHEVLTMGSMNFIEREVEGLRPDIALVGAAPSHLEIYRYTPRLMGALGSPPVVIPTHADNFRGPYGSELAYRHEWVEAFIWSRSGCRCGDCRGSTEDRLQRSAARPYPPYGGSDDSVFHREPCPRS